MLNHIQGNSPVQFYLDGRFYTLVARLPSEGPSHDDILVVERLSTNSLPSRPMAVLAGALEDAAREGRAVLLRGGNDSMGETVCIAMPLPISGGAGATVGKLAHT